MEYKEEMSNKIDSHDDNIYPKLPSAPSSAEHPRYSVGHTYRLQKINEIQKMLEEERDRRLDLSKKYHRSVEIINGIDTALVATIMGLGVAGVGLLSTIIAAPAVLAMEGAALCTGLY